jgi:signal peptidase I
MNQPENEAVMLACGLAGDIVRTFGEVRLRVFGTSMVPSILPGDLISVQRAGVPEISRGEIVLYSREGRLFIHRVVACTNSPEQPLLVTRGDRLNYNDPPVSSAELLGRVTSIECGDRCGGRQVEIVAPPFGSNCLMLRVLRSSDRATYLYLQLAVLWRDRFPRRMKCPV